MGDGVLQDVLGKFGLMVLIAEAVCTVLSLDTRVRARVRAQRLRTREGGVGAGWDVTHLVYPFGCC